MFLSKLFPLRRTGLLSLQVLYFLFFFSITVLEDAKIFAQSSEDIFYFDAESTSFSHGGDRKVFSGNVLALKKNVLILADEVVYHPPYLEASGDILGIFNYQVFRTSSLKYHLDTYEFTLNNVFYVTQDPILARGYVYKALGISEKERDFEKIRREKIKDLLKEQQSYLKQIKKLKKNQPKSTELLSVLRDQLQAKLMHELNLRNQKNPVLARMLPSQRDLYLRRRSFWKSLPHSHSMSGLFVHLRGEESQEKTQRASLQGSEELPYLRIEAKKLTKTSDGELKAEEVHLTPCECNDEEELEEPAPWSLRAQNLRARQEGYLTLRNPYVLVSGYPVFYVPRLRFPLKTKPQSGLLSPEFLWDTRFGYSISPSLYLYFSERADMTLSPEVFSNREDLRLRGEHRMLDESSGLLYVKWEGMKHSAWLEEQSFRERRKEEWFRGGGLTTELRCHGSMGELTELEKEFCNTLWDSLQRKQQKIRGKIGYEAKKDFSPHISLFAKGEIYSDHRYAEELEVTTPSPLTEDLDPFSSVKTFAANRYHMAWYGQTLQAHLRGSLGDHFLMRAPFQGLQSPLSFEAYTPFYQMMHSSRISLYMRGSFNYKVISEQEDVVEPLYSTTNTSPSYLSSVGSGDWASWILDLNAPFRLDHRLVSYFFLTAEHRHIRPRQELITSTQMSSPLAGVTFSVPFRGEKNLGELPVYSRNPYYENSSLEHGFDIGASFSLRPWVWRYGNYGGENPQWQGKTYFASDDERLAEQDFARFSRKMSPHKKITFFTRHNLDLNHHYAKPRSWIQGKKDHIQESSLGSLTQALVDRTLNEGTAGKSSPEYYSKIQDFPLEVEVSVDYDLEGAPRPSSTAPLEAQDQSMEEDAPNSPWQDFKVRSELGFPYGKIGTQGSYNFQKDSTAFHAFIALKDVYSTDVSFDFTQDREALSDALTRLLKPGVHTYSVKANTRVMRQWSLFAHYSLKNVLDFPEQFTSHEYGLHYLPDHGCWGFRFSRHKPFAFSNLSGDGLITYRLQLKVILGPSSFQTPNLLSVL